MIVTRVKATRAAFTCPLEWFHANAITPGDPSAVVTLYPRESLAASAAGRPVRVRVCAECADSHLWSGDYDRAHPDYPHEETHR